MWEHSCSHPSSKRTLSLECCSQSRVGENNLSHIFTRLSHIFTHFSHLYPSLTSLPISLTSLPVSHIFTCLCVPIPDTPPSLPSVVAPSGSVALLPLCVDDCARSDSLANENSASLTLLSSASYWCGEPTIPGAVAGAAAAIGGAPPSLTNTSFSSTSSWVIRWFMSQMWLSRFISRCSFKLLGSNCIDIIINVSFPHHKEVKSPNSWYIITCICYIDTNRAHTILKIVSGVLEH